MMRCHDEQPPMTDACLDATGGGQSKANLGSLFVTMAEANTTVRRGGCGVAAMTGSAQMLRTAAFTNRTSKEPCLRV